MKKLLMVIMSLGACVATAANYTWNGGTSGTWNASANWQPSTGVPNVGDTATFNGATTITDGIAIGSGTLTIVRNADVTLEGVVSGSGALSLSGAGVAHLKGANTFSGGLTVIGTQTTAAASDLTGSVKIWLFCKIGHGHSGVWHGVAA